MLLPYFATKMYLLVKKETKKNENKILAKCLMVANNSIPKELIKKIFSTFSFFREFVYQIKSVFALVSLTSDGMTHIG